MLISGHYKQKSIQFILTDIFKNTDINFYISSDNKIILTQNSFVYDSLPVIFLEVIKPLQPLMRNKNLFITLKNPT